MPHRVYVVEGNTGIYEDYSDWIACVCASKQTANARARKLNAIAAGHRHYSYGDSVDDPGCHSCDDLVAALKAAGDVNARRPDSRPVTYNVLGPFTLVHHA